MSAASAAQAAAERRQAASMDALRARITAALKKQGLADAVQFQSKEQRGLVVNIVTDRVLFDLGEATLRPQGARVLDAIAPVLKGLPNEMVVEGHTDNLPISDTRFASNWELSTQRATTVLRHLLSRGLAPRKVAAAGYADQRPLEAGHQRHRPCPQPAGGDRHPDRRRDRVRVRQPPPPAAVPPRCPGVPAVRPAVPAVPGA